MIDDPTQYTGLFTWEEFVTIEHTALDGQRETTFLTRRSYEESGIRPALAGLPTIDHFKRGYRFKSL
jgi:hypothetical protein